MEVSFSKLFADSAMRLNGMALILRKAQYLRLTHSIILGFKPELRWKRFAQQDDHTKENQYLNNLPVTRSNFTSNLARRPPFSFKGSWNLLSNDLLWNGLLVMITCNGHLRNCSNSTAKSIGSIRHPKTRQRTLIQMECKCSRKITWTSPELSERSQKAPRKQLRLVTNLDFN